MGLQEGKHVKTVEGKLSLSAHNLMSKFLVVFFIVVGVLASWVVADTSISVDGELPTI